ncbi:MAG: flagellar protein FliT [Oceanospirillaceae bacterium]|nr:flagellar protein FliT [Oceanospirillaceae bacterium]
MIDLAQELLSLSQKMLSCAENKEWQALETIQAKRLLSVQKLEAEESKNLTKAESEIVSRLLHESRALEKQCEQLAAIQRKSFITEHSKISKGKAMKKAYGA